VTTQSAEHLDPEAPVQGGQNPLIAINVFSRYGSMAITMVVGFLLTPFLIHAIGKTAYGLQSLSYQALEFTAMLALAVGISYERIAAAYYARGEYDRMNATLSGGLILSLAIACIIALATDFMVIFADTLFDLEVELQSTARWVLLIFGTGAMLQIINGVYQAPVFMTQRLYAESLGSLLSVVLPAAIVVPLFMFGHPSIITWVALSVGARLAVQWCFVIPLGRRGLHQLNIRLFAAGARKEMGELVNFGGLALVGKLGVLLFYATDSIMISHLNELGLDDVTNYNVAQRWFPQISMLASGLVWILGPAMTTQVAMKRFDELRTTVTKVTRYCFIILAYPSLLLILYSEPFLRYWLKSAFVPESVGVMRVIMCALLAGSAGLVSMEALYACRKIRKAVIATLIGGVLNVVLSIALVKVGGMGLLGIAVGSLVSLLLLQVVCMPLLLCHEISLSYSVLMRGALRALSGAIPLVGACLVLHYAWKPESLPQVFVQFLLCGLVYAPSAWFISMTASDRCELVSATRTAWTSYRDRNRPAQGGAS